jgi:hypothetical protein
VLNPLLYSLFTHDCVAEHDSNTIIKSVDDTTVVGLITDDDETAYREKVRDLSVWCQDNNLSLYRGAYRGQQEMKSQARPHSHDFVSIC